MAEALKHFFDERVVRAIARDFARAHPGFSERTFVARCVKKLPELELTARAWHIAEMMHSLLPSPFTAAARVLLDAMGPELESTDGNGMAPFRYLPHVFFVQKYGLDDFEPALHVQYELTKRLTAESSIRPYLERYPKQTLARLHQWAKDPNVHVRRLVSEGTRPRLPWAPRLREFQRDPGPVLGLLELLKDDPERYVQRSVANNLNDISKDHPALVAEVCARWSKGAPEGRSWIVKHALRSLVKQGDAAALAVVGAAEAPAAEIQRVQVQPTRVRLGNVVRVSFDLVSTAQQSQDLLIDYAVHFVKANGKPRPKVFKLRRLTLGAGALVRLEARISFASMTTRTPYPGSHRVELTINGKSCDLCEFEVLA